MRPLARIECFPVFLHMFPNFVHFTWSNRVGHGYSFPHSSPGRHNLLALAYRPASCVETVRANEMKAETEESHCMMLILRCFRSNRTPSIVFRLSDRRGFGLKFCRGFFFAMVLSEVQEAKPNSLRKICRLRCDPGNPGQIQAVQKDVFQPTVTDEAEGNTDPKPSAV